MSNIFSIFKIGFFIILILASCEKENGINQATCTDGIQNGLETGIDCGGDCTACISCIDGIQNGNETGIDCGGDCAEDCEVLTTCDGQSPCMQANIDGIFWEGLGFNVEFETISFKEVVTISSVNFTFGVNTSVVLPFLEPSSSNLPLMIKIDDSTPYEERPIIVRLDPPGEENRYVGHSGEVELTTFDENNKTATGTFNFTGQTINAFGQIINATASDGKFSVQW